MPRLRSHDVDDVDCVQQNVRQRLAPSSSNSDAIEQCPVVQKERCNTRSCPGRHHCHYLKCRFNYHAASEKFAIQVYHHHKEPHNVHHCKLYTLADGTKKCHCYCWYLGPTGKMLNP